LKIGKAKKGHLSPPIVDRYGGIAIYNRRDR